MLFIFESYVLDPGRRELRRGDSVVPVQPQVFDLLEYLIRNRGRVVSRDDMLEAVWGGRIVSESTLATRINAARSAIGDDGDSQRLIRTLPRKGIRFVGDVRESQEAPQQTRAPSGPSATAGAAPPRAEAERRHLTVMSCDFVGLRELATQLDPEELGTVHGICQACCAQVASRWDGALIRFADDAATLLFSYPQAHEDDAERAIRAGLDLLERVARLETGRGNALSARIGVATGLVVIGGSGGEGNVIGEAPTVAAALRRGAGPGILLTAPSTQSLLGNLFEYEAYTPAPVAGISSPMPAWRVVRPSAVESRFEALRNKGLTPFFGREEEMALLARKWREAKAGKGGVVLITGEPGIGKSRIVSELEKNLAQSEQYTRMRYQCSPHYRDSALHPIIAQFERAAVLTPDDPPEQRLDKLEAAIAIPAPHRKTALPLLAALLSIPTAGRYPPLAMSPMQQRRQTLGVLLDELEALTRRRPVLVVFEDAHWADPTSLELLDLMIERIRRLPVLALITARPEFEAPWAGLPNASALPLERLGPDEAQAIVEKLAEGQLPPEVSEQIIARTDGVPLFIEELTKDVLDTRLPRDARAQQSNGSGSVPSIPSTLEDTLRARIDRLGPAKDVAQVGAAIGRSFTAKLIAAATGRDAETVAPALERLVEDKLVLQHGAPPDARYTFKHALVQDAAYESLLRSQRIALHARIAAVIESGFPEIVENEPELLAQHCARADLGDKAVGYWLKAGRRAVGRSANIEAISHLRNGLERLSTIAPEQERAQFELQLQLILGQALIAARGYTAPETKRAFARAEELVEKAGDVGQRYSTLYGVFVGHLIGGQIEAASEAIDRIHLLASSEEDEAYLCLVYRLRGNLSFFRGDLHRALDELEKAVALYGPAVQQQLGQHFGPDTGAAAQIFLAMTEWLAGLPESAQRTAQSAIENARKLGNALTLGQVLSLAAQLHYMAQDYDAMLQLSKEGAESCDRAGIRYFGAICRLYQIWAQAWRSEPGEYIKEFRSALAAYEEMGCGLQLGFFHAMLAQLLLAAKRLAEAAKEADGALARVMANGERWWAPEIYRGLGNALLASSSPPDEVEAENAFERAVEEAHRAGALTLELRAATSLAEIASHRGDAADARAVLAKIVAAFGEGIDSAELRTAKALLDRRPSA